MQRRSFLRSIGSGVIATSLSPAFALGNVGAKSIVGVDKARAFHDAFLDVPESWGPTRLAFQGRWPAGLSGTLYRNGPARMHRGPTSLRHWFDGDGMVHAWRIGDGRVEHRAKMVRTSRYIEEERAGRYLRGNFGTSFADELPSDTPDDVNVANISVLPLPGSDGRPEVLALWEAGSPWRIAPDSLETLGRKAWTPETDGMPFSAHPRVDGDGSVWSFGYLAGSGKLALYQVSPAGALLRTAMIEAPNADMVHDFAITERYLVFVLMPLVYGEDKSPAAQHAAFVDRYRWHGERPNVVLVVDKATWQTVARVEVPAFALFHLGNAWEEGGLLHLPVVRVADFGVAMAEIRAMTRGEPTSRKGRSDLIRVVVDPARRTGRIETTGLAATEFPAWDKRFTGRRVQSHYGLAKRDPASVLFDAVVRFDWQTGRTDGYAYGSDWIVDEHLFVPQSGDSTQRGWVIGTAYHAPTKRTTLSVFDAGHLSNGPLAQARLPYGVPPGLHGAFVAS